MCSSVMTDSLLKTIWSILRSSLNYDLPFEAFSKNKSFNRGYWDKNGSNKEKRKHKMLLLWGGNHLLFMCKTCTKISEPPVNQSDEFKVQKTFAETNN